MDDDLNCLVDAIIEARSLSCVYSLLTRQTLVAAIRDEAVSTLAEPVETVAVWHLECALLVDGTGEAQQRCCRAVETSICQRAVSRL